MAWTNGYRLISNTGTWLEFFNAVKSAMQENTGYNIINDDTDYSFTIDFGNGFTCVVSDSVITDESIATRSNALKLMIYQNSVLKNSITISYGGNSAQTENTTRTISIFTYSNDKIKILGIDQYNSSIPYIQLSSRAFIECKYKDIATSEEKNIFKIHNTTMHDLNGNNLVWTTTFSKSSNGIVLLNELITQGSEIAGYLPDIYNCTTIQPYSHYMINNQKYYSIDPNLLVKE